MPPLSPPCHPAPLNAPRMPSRGTGWAGRCHLPQARLLHLAAAPDASRRCGCTCLLHLPAPRSLASHLPTLPACSDGSPTLLLCVGSWRSCGAPSSLPRPEVGRSHSGGPYLRSTRAGHGTRLHTRCLHHAACLASHLKHASSRCRRALTRFYYATQERLRLLRVRSIPRTQAQRELRSLTSRATTLIMNDQNGFQKILVSMQ